MFEKFEEKNFPASPVSGWIYEFPGILIFHGRQYVNNSHGDGNNKKLNFYKYFFFPTIKRWKADDFQENGKKVKSDSDRNVVSEVFVSKRLEIRKIRGRIRTFFTLRTLNKEVLAEKRLKFGESDPNALVDSGNNDPRSIWMVGPKDQQDQCVSDDVDAKRGVKWKPAGV